MYQISKVEPNICSDIFQNKTHTNAHISPGYIGDDRVPATKIKPPRYQITAANSLVHSTYHSHYSTLSEPKSQRDVLH